MSKELENKLYEVEHILKRNKEYNYGYRVFHAKADEEKWNILLDFSTDYRSFRKAVMEGVKKGGTDVVRIEVWSQVGQVSDTGKSIAKKKGEHIVKLTDVWMNIVDQPKEETEKKQNISSAMINPYDYEATQNQLRDSIKETEQYKYESQLAGMLNQNMMLQQKNEKEVMQIRHENEVARLTDQLDALKKEKESLETEYEELLSEYTTIEKKLAEETDQNKKGMTVATMVGLGKLLGLEKKELLGLAGAWLGGGPEALTAEDETSAQQPTAEMSPEQKQRQMQMAQIYQWMNELSDDQFQRFGEIIVKLNTDKSLIEAVYNYLTSEDSEE